MHNTHAVNISNFAFPIDVFASIWLVGAARYAMNCMKSQMELLSWERDYRIVRGKLVVVKLV